MRALNERAIRQLYAERRGIEIAYRWLKTTLDGRRMLSHTPSHAQVELEWMMISLWMLSLLTLCDATIQQGLSLASALRVVHRALKHQCGRLINVASQLWQSRADNYENGIKEDEATLAQAFQKTRLPIPQGAHGKPCGTDLVSITYDSERVNLTNDVGWHPSQFHREIHARDRRSRFRRVSSGLKLATHNSIRYIHPSHETRAKRAVGSQ